MLGWLIQQAIHLRVVMLGLLVALLIGGGLAARALPIDALPDISTIQVSLRAVGTYASIEDLESVVLKVALSLEGVEGRLFKPMATTMAFALFGALVYAVVFLPALLALFVPPAKHGTSAWLRALTRGYMASLPWALRLRWPLLAGAAPALVAIGSSSAAKAPTSCRASTRATWW